MNTKTAAIIPVLLTILTCPLSAQSSLEREWQDATGKFKVNAALESIDARGVNLRLVDGRLIAVPIEKFGAQEKDVIDAVVAIEQSRSQYELLKPHFSRMLVSPDAVVEIFEQIHLDLHSGVAAGLLASCVRATTGDRKSLAIAEKTLDQTILRVSKIQKQFPDAHKVTLMSALNNRSVLYLRDRKADLAVRALVSAAELSTEIPFVVYHNATILLEESAPPSTLTLSKQSRSDLVKLLAVSKPEGPGSTVPRRFMYSTLHDDYDSVVAKQSSEGSVESKAIEQAGEYLPIEPGFQKFGTGTGFLVSPKLLITNRHVVEGFESGLRFRIKNETDYPRGIIASVRKVSNVEDSDLALLELAAPIPNRALPIREDIARIGEGLSVVGYPIPDLFEQSVTVSSGVVSKFMASGRHILHDASTSGGNSGSPCLDENGNVIGVHFSKFKFEVSGGNNRNLAVSGSAVRDFLKDTSDYVQLPPKQGPTTRPDMISEVTKGVFLVEIWAAAETIRSLNALKALPDDAPEIAIKKFGLWPELTCFACQGTGVRDCKVCVGGVVGVLRPTQVGVNSRGEPITVNRKFPVPCEACNGRSGFKCQACQNGRLNY